MKARTNFPARLHVLLARESDVGLVIRRGPANCVCTLLWDRAKDTFELGQWMKARMYERRADISPDGIYFIYFAMNGRWHTKTKGSWTAISRVPYLKAIILFAKGDCWHGGGLFLSANEYWLNDGWGHKKLHEAPEVTRNKAFKLPEYYGGECLTVYYNRLQRDGWKVVELNTDAPSIFEKKLPNGWMMRKLAYSEIHPLPGRRPYWDAHELRHEPSKIAYNYSDWEWADWDRNRLVWAAQGQIWTGELGDGALYGERVLADFNDMKFEAIPAPY